MVKAPSCHRLKHTEGAAMIELLYQHACYVTDSLIPLV